MRWVSQSPGEAPVVHEVDLTGEREVVEGTAARARSIIETVGRDTMKVPSPLQPTNTLPLPYHPFTRATPCSLHTVTIA